MKTEVLPQNSKLWKGDTTQVPFEDTQILGATGKKKLIARDLRAPEIYTIKVLFVPHREYRCFR